MKLVVPVECIDLETKLFLDGMAAPEMIVMAWSDGSEEKLLVPWEGEDPYDRFEQILRRKKSVLINQHIFFDLGVLCAARPHLVPLVFEALEDGRIRCLKVREQLIRIARGEAKFLPDVADDEEPDEEEKQQKTRFDLAAIAKRWLGLDVAKEGTWRKSYGLLEGIPLARWPESAREYSITDVRVSLAVWAEQDKFISLNFDGELPGEVDSNCAAWTLHLMKIWGVRTCPEAVAKLTRDLQMTTLWTTLGLLMTGILRKGGTGAKPKAVETKAETQRRIVAAFAARGEEAPLTGPSKTFPEGQIKTARKVLEDSKDETLVALAEHKGFTKILSTYIPKYVAKGIRVPICADWNPLVESGRISCANPNLTNPPRAGDVRSCFKAREQGPQGRTVYVSADFDQAELRSWAQVCLVMFGHSTMAEAFKQGVDPHLKLAAELMGISLDEAVRRYADGDKEVDDKRQFAKEPNFGLIGGMGPPKFMERAALKKIFLTLEQSKAIRNTWMQTWPEAKEYLDYFASLFDDHRHPNKLDCGDIFDTTTNTLYHPITGFARGGCGYSDGANQLFQHLTAWGAKQALWDLSKECYLDRRSPIYSARPVIHMHDEIFGEIPEKQGHEGAARWGAVMQKAMEKWIRDVPVKCTPVLTRRLFKGAKPVFLNGILVPSKPVKIDGKTKWVADLGDDEPAVIARAA